MLKYFKITRWLLASSALLLLFLYLFNVERKIESPERLRPVLVRALKKTSLDPALIKGNQIKGTVSPILDHNLTIQKEQGDIEFLEVDRDNRKYNFIDPTMIDEVLKTAKKLEKMKSEVIKFPACYIGEYYPFVGKPDRYEVELFISTSFGEHSDKSEELGFDEWPINKNSQFTIFSLGQVLNKASPDYFMSPDSEKESEVGLLVVFENEIYQIFRKSADSLAAKVFKKKNGEWSNLTEFTLKIYEGSGQDCFYAKHLF